MPEIIECPQCQRKLNILEDHLGRAVKCPACGSTFTAEVPEIQAPPLMTAKPVWEERSEPPEVERVPRSREGARRSVRYEDDEEWDNFEGRPHRGEAILILGLLALVLCWIPLAGWIMGGIAISMGNNDLQEMARGRVDRSGRSSTQAGKTCGTIAVVVSTLLFMLCCMFRLASMN